MPFGGSDPSGVIIGPYTKADTPLPMGPCRAINVGTALNGIDTRGNVVTAYPAQTGINPIQLKQISTGGTATDIWLLY
jgi:hypothetical protein